MAFTKELFSNDAQTTLAGAINNVATTASLATGAGALFPHPGANEYFRMTFRDSATGLQTEIVFVTDITGDDITMVRGQEGTVAQAWVAGDKAYLSATAGTLQSFQQVPAAQSQANNYAVDTGTADNYIVALTPALTTYQAGTPIRVMITHTNTGPATLNAGPGSLPIINPDGTALGANTLVAGGIYEFIPDGAGNLELVSANTGALSALGIATTGDWKWKPTEETLAGWVKANATTIGNATSGASQLQSATAQALYIWLWTNFSNTQCPVTGGRGLSALADFIASKAIAVLDMRGIGIGGMDTMGGAVSALLAGVPAVSGNSTTAGSVLGENLHALITAELAAHNHAITDPTHNHSHSDPGHLHSITDPQHSHSLANAGWGNWDAIHNDLVRPAGGNSGSVFNATQANATGISINPNTTGISNVANSTGITVNSAGSGTAHNTYDRKMIGTHYLKL